MTAPNRKDIRPAQPDASPQLNRSPAKTTDPLSTAIIQDGGAEKDASGKRWPPYLAPENVDMFTPWQHSGEPWTNDGLPNDPMADAAERMPEVLDRICTNHQSHTRDYLRKLIGQTPGIHYADCVKFAPYRDTPVNRELDELIRGGEILIDQHTHRLTPSPEFFGPDLLEARLRTWRKTSFGSR
jgi:hypothetical protein